MYALPSKQYLTRSSSLTHRAPQAIVRLPTQEERSRLLRYAFWIKRISGVITRRFEAFFDVLQFCTSDETPFPNLRVLSWSIYPSFLRFLPLFVSPRISTFSLGVFQDAPFDPRRMERDYLAATVAALPASLRKFALRVNPPGLGSDQLKQEVLYVAQRSGPTLTHLETDLELSTLMVHHVMRFPNLHTWRADGNLLPATPTPSSDAITYLPALRSLALSAANAYDWVAFLASSHPTVTALRSTLTKLNLSGDRAVHPSLISQVCAFTNLAHLNVWSTCPEDRCVFALADDDLSDLSLSLPRLEWLMLGHQCDKNTCRTTFKSLLFLSARCPSLVSIAIHFNTMQIVRDVRSILETEDPRIKELRESPTRSQLVTFSVSKTPLSLVGSDELEVLKRGFLNVFPRLRGISRRYGRTWQCLTDALEK